MLFLLLPPAVTVAMGSYLKDESVVFKRLICFVACKEKEWWKHLWDAGEQSLPIWQ